MEVCAVHEKVSKASEAYSIIKERIISLEYVPGQVLNEAEMAAEFGMSRTVVRNIFAQLKNKNLVSNIPRYGTQVMPIDLRYMKSVFEAVREQEGFAASLAAQRMPEEKIGELMEIIEQIKGYDQDIDHRTMLKDDARFHDIVIMGCENPCIIQQLHDLHQHTERFWHSYHKSLSDHELFFETLADLAMAIKCRDPQKADICAKAHVDAFVETIRQVLL